MARTLENPNRDDGHTLLDAVSAPMYAGLVAVMRAATGVVAWDHDDDRLIVAALQGSRVPMTQQEIAIEIVRSKRHVGQRCRALVARGTIQRGTNGYKPKGN